MKTEELYLKAKNAQINLGTASAGEVALAKLVSALEKIDFKDLSYRFCENEIIELFEFVMLRASK